MGHAHSHNCNLLANIGPLPDGEVHPEDVALLRAIGKRIRTQGWPETTDQPLQPKQHDTNQAA